MGRCHSHRNRVPCRGPHRQRALDYPCLVAYPLFGAAGPAALARPSGNSEASLVSLHDVSWFLGYGPVVLADLPLAAIHVLPNNDIIVTFVARPSRLKHFISMFLVPRILAHGTLPRRRLYLVVVFKIVLVAAEVSRLLIARVEVVGTRLVWRLLGRVDVATGFLTGSGRESTGVNGRGPPEACHLLVTILDPRLIHGPVSYSLAQLLQVFCCRIPLFGSVPPRTT